ncbi:hypothetical protein [Phenylobacterium sp.]|uniref:hypothetical protein n=1 Tax=Phenylobacterium sp. TaxID=1871053 RepID=UPI002F42568B
MIVICGGALWKGSREEQTAAGGVLLSVLVTVMLRDPKWAGTQWGAFGSDLGLLILLVAIALRTPKFWPLFAAAFQLLCVVTHIARVVDPGVRAWAYATAQVIWTQWVLFAIGVGTFNNWRRNRQLATSAPPTATPGATRR